MCKDLYGGDPPCHECGWEELLPQNRLARDLWRMGDAFRDVDRMAGVPVRLDIPTVLDLCRAYDATREDFEKVLLIERIAYPHIVERAKAQADRG